MPQLANGYLLKVIKSYKQRGPFATATYCECACLMTWPIGILGKEDTIEAT